MSPRALVTGATGMLGSYIVDHAHDRGWSVTALLRTAAGQSRLQRRGADVAVGRLEDVGSLVRAAEGCDVIFHAAAVIGSGGDWEAFRRANVEGTGHVVQASEASGARLVHISSTAVYGRARYGDDPTDENVPLPGLPDHDVYGRSKQDAERLVLEAHEAGRIWATAVRPPVMYGKGDRQFAPRVGAVLARGFFPRIGGGGSTLTVAYAGSVAEGAFLAATTDSAGGRVFLLANDHPVTTSDLVRCAEAGLRRPIWAPSIPVPVGRTGFGALRVALTAVGRGDLARHARGTLEMLTRDNPFTSARARSELGWAPAVEPEVSLTEALSSWWRERQSTGVRGRRSGSFPLS